MQQDEDKPEKILVIPDSVEDSSSKQGSIDPQKSSGQTEDSKIDEAIDDISARDSDSLIEKEDEEIAEAFQKPTKGWKARIKRLISNWWHNPKARNLSFAGVGALLIGLIILPTTRYFFMNSVGIRSSAFISVLDNSTQLPLKNVEVKIQNQSGLTDENGTVKVEHLKLGNTKLNIYKRAFAVNDRSITIGWGSNNLGKFPLRAVGAQFSFYVKDWLSGKPIERAEADSGSASAFSDADGKILLTIDTADVKDNMSVTIKAGGYIDQEVELDANTQTQKDIKMVASGKIVFVSKRSGKYDLYTIDADGKNEKKILEGTGYERDDMVLVPHPTDEVVAFVSTRVNARDNDGYLLDTLSLIDINQNTTLSVGQSESIQLVGWVGNKLLYIQIAAGSSASNPNRYQLMSYDYKTTDKTTIASANSFNDVVLASGNVYYAPSTAYTKDKNIGFKLTSADGNSQQTILNKEVWNIFRVGYDKFDLSVGHDWYEYSFGDSIASKLVGAPANPVSRVYIDNSDGLNSIWVDQRDGKGVLLDYDTVTKQDKILQTKSGISNPLRWLNKRTLVYRIKTDQETADYVLSLDGGSPQKVADVTNTKGIDRWYYYQ